jgi:hypothetical protein
MTTPTLREAAQAALDALESLQGGCTDSGDGTVEALTVWCPEVVEALRAALAEDGRDWSLLAATQESLREHMAEIRTLRAALAHPQPAPLKDSEVASCWNFTPWNADLKTRVFHFARAIEAAHGIVPAPTTGEGQ